MPAPTPNGDDHTSSLRLIAVVAAFAVIYWLSSILVPFFLAMVVAIVLSPLADRIERAGLGRTLASLISMLMVATALLGIVALIGYQAGSMVKDGDKYVQRIAEVTAKSVRAVGGDKAMRSLAVTEEAADGKTAVKKTGADALVTRIREGFGRDAQQVRQWAMTGINGLLGIVADTVIFLAFLFYLLQGRSEWIERLRKAALGLGMRPRDQEFGRVGYEVRTYLSTLAMVSLGYSVVISVVLWLLGVPQPVLWGALTAVLELVPFFGPFIAGALPTLASLGSGGALWKPFAVIGVFAALQTIEGYVVAPLLYGKAVAIEPVTVILGVLFFGWLLGPAGLALAMPLMILLRGLLVITPDTPALDALADAEQEADRAKVSVPR
jgi:predicted PurR-regulated permease PerM